MMWPFTCVHMIHTMLHDVFTCLLMWPCTCVHMLHGMIHDVLACFMMKPYLTHDYIIHKHIHDIISDQAMVGHRQARVLDASPPILRNVRARRNLAIVDDPSPLATSILDKWAWGNVSAVDAQDLAHSARLAGLTQDFHFKLNEHIITYNSNVYVINY